MNTVIRFAVLVLLVSVASAGAAEDKARKTHLERFHRLRSELLKAAEPLEDAFLAWHRAEDAEAASKALEKCRSTAEVLQPLVAAQSKTLEDAEVPDACRALNKVHLRSLEFGYSGIRRFLGQAKEGGRPVRNESVLSPTGRPEDQRRLSEELGKLLGEKQTEPEQKAKERIEQEIARSRKIDRPFRDASGLWRAARTMEERRDAVLAFVKALEEMEKPLLEQYGRLRKIDVPPRHRDLLAALREAVRLEIVVCRRLPPAFRSGSNRGIGMWTSVMNEVLNPKARMAGVDPIAEARGETEDR